MTGGRVSTKSYAVTGDIVSLTLGLSLVSVKSKTTGKQLSGLSHFYSREIKKGKYFCL